MNRLCHKHAGMHSVVLGSGNYEMKRFLEKDIKLILDANKDDEITLVTNAENEYTYMHSVPLDSHSSLFEISIDGILSEINNMLGEEKERQIHMTEVLITVCSLLSNENLFEFGSMHKSLINTYTGQAKEITIKSLIEFLSTAYIPGFMDIRPFLEELSGYVLKANVTKAERFTLHSVKADKFDCIGKYLLIEKLYMSFKQSEIQNWMFIDYVKEMTKNREWSGVTERMVILARRFKVRITIVSPNINNNTLISTSKWFYCFGEVFILSWNINQTEKLRKIFQEIGHFCTQADIETLTEENGIGVSLIYNSKIYCAI